MAYLDTVAGAARENQGDPGEIATAEIANLGVTAAKLAADAVETAKIAANAVTTAKLDVSTIQYAAVSIAAAAVAALRAAPATLVAAPGAGKVLEFISAELLLDYVAPGFTETDDNLAVRYTDGSGAIVSQAIECTGFIDQTGDTRTNALAKIDAIVAKAGCENQALVLHNTGNGEFANSGGSALRVKVAYRVHTTGW